MSPRTIFFASLPPFFGSQQDGTLQLASFANTSTFGMSYSAAAVERLEAVQRKSAERTAAATAAAGAPRPFVRADEQSTVPSGPPPAVPLGSTSSVPPTLAPAPQLAKQVGSYQAFCKEQRPLLPTDLRNAERERMLGQMWKVLSEAEKEQLGARWGNENVGGAAAYNEFCRRQRPLLPTVLGGNERERLLGQMWKALSKTQRGVYALTLTSNRAPTTAHSPSGTREAAVAELRDYRGNHRKAEDAKAAARCAYLGVYLGSTDNCTSTTTSQQGAQLHGAGTFHVEEKTTRTAREEVRRLLELARSSQGEPTGFEGVYSSGAGFGAELRKGAKRLRQTGFHSPFEAALERARWAKLTDLGVAYRAILVKSVCRVSSMPRLPGGMLY